MFACILVFTLFLPAALLPCMLCTLFSARELNEMGVQLDDVEATESMPDMNFPSACLAACLGVCF